MALSLINSSTNSFHVADSKIRTASSNEKIKSRCCTRGSISNIVSQCSKSCFTPVDVKEREVFSIDEENDNRVSRISVIQQGDDLKYKLIWKSGCCIRRKPLIGSIPHIPGYSTPEMIQHLQSAEVKIVPGQVLFLKRRQSWNIQNENKQAVNIDLLQQHITLIFRINIGSETSYTPIVEANENAPIEDRVRVISQTAFIFNKSKVLVAARLFHKIINNVEISLLANDNTLVWQTKKKNAAILHQQMTRDDEVKYMNGGELALEIDYSVFYETKYIPSFVKTYARALEVSKEVGDRFEISLLSGTGHLIWEIYEKSTETFFQYPCPSEKSFDDFLSYVQNHDIKVKESTSGFPARQLSVSLKKVSKVSKLDGSSIIDADQSAVTLVNSFTRSHVDFITWGGHAKIIFEFLRNKEHIVWEAHLIENEGSIIISQPLHKIGDFQRARTYTRSKQLVDGLLADIENQKAKPVAFDLMGGNILKETKCGGNVTANCTTWSIVQLKKINIEIEAPASHVFESIARAIVTAPVQYTKSLYLRGPESVRFYYDVIVPVFIRNTFSARQEVALERFIQKKIGAKNWCVISDDNWNSTGSVVKNREIPTGALKIAGPILISIGVEGKTLKLDVTKEILADVKNVGPRILDELRKSKSALAGILALFSVVQPLDY